MKKIQENHNNIKFYKYENNSYETYYECNMYRKEGRTGHLPASLKLAATTILVLEYKYHLLIY